MYSQIKAILFDIDGVITDGKKYINGEDEIKSINLKDLDALNMLKGQGYIIGAVTGEDTSFSRKLERELHLDIFLSSCKQKGEAIEQIAERFHLRANQICYIGDGKYDIDALQKAELAICPSDAIAEVKRVSNITLTRAGGQGCISEVYSLLQSVSDSKHEQTALGDESELIIKRMNEHSELLQKMTDSREFSSELSIIVNRIVESYSHKGRLLLCGNGGSAANAQHLAAELVSGFYLEREALSAEALHTDTSVITAIANDYDYDRFFAREVEAKGREGDILLAISAGGRLGSIIAALKTAKKKDICTVLFSGDILETEEVLQYADFVLRVPSIDTPRIQEMHMLAGHIMCEMIEKKVLNIKGGE